MIAALACLLFVSVVVLNIVKPEKATGEFYFGVSIVTDLLAIIGF